MTYAQIQDFRLGMDRRRVDRFMGEIGSLWVLKNGHLSRGGDVVRRKKFVATYTLPSGTKGLQAVNNSLYVFGPGADPGVPSGVTYQRNEHPTEPAATITKIVDSSYFDGKPYSIARFSDGNDYHYYNGTRVTDWDILAQDIGSNAAVASALADRLNEGSAVTALAASNVVTITAATAGTAYTISASTINNGAVGDESITLLETQANAAGVSEVLATADITIDGGSSNPGTNKITSITVDGAEILNASIDWTTSHSNTASLIAAQIDSHNSTPEYTADANGATVTVSAVAGSGAAPNGFSVVVTTAGDVTDTSDSTMSGGVTAVTATAQVYTATIGGTFESADVFTVTINGVDYTVTGAAAGTGTSLIPFRSKMYSTAGANLYFSDLDAPTQWVEDEDALDPGFINMASQNNGQEALTGVAEYQGLLAIFSQNAIRVWSIVEASGSNVFIQSVPETGTRASGSIQPFGNDDVFYLAETGVRSLKARDSSNAAFVSDVGTAIDTFIQEYLQTLTSDQIDSAKAIIEPVDGRYWLACGNYIFVFSFFPSAKISAWSYYDVGMEITEFAKIGSTIYARAGDVIYTYGGANGTTYPDAGEDEIEVGLPYITAGEPATNKTLMGYDLICSNTWTVKVLPKVDDDTVELNAGVAAGTTYGKPSFDAPGDAPAFALKLTCNKAGAATLSGIALHYKGGESG